MNDDANQKAATPHRRGYSDEVYESAFNISIFLYDLWRKHNENAIIKEDKTINDNEESSAN